MRRSGACIVAVVLGFLPDAARGQNADGGGYCSIAVDGQGYVHCVHCDYTVDSGYDYVRYTRISPAQVWDTSILTSRNGWDAYAGCNVAVGEFGYVHAAWQEYWGTGAVRYAWFDGSAWSPVESVDTAADYGDELVMAVSGSTVFVMYSGNGDYAGLCRRRTGGAWSARETVFTNDHDGASAAVTDAAGNLHVLYARENNLYYRKRTTAWQEEQLIHGGIGYYTYERAGIALDSAGKVHVTYTGDDLGFRPYYANNVAGSWAVVGVIDAAATSELGFCRIAIGPAGSIHAAYLDENTGKCKYARWTGTNWIITVIGDMVANAGPDIAVDASSTVHITYGNNNKLYYRQIQPVRISDPRCNGSAFEVLVKTTSGRNYALEYRDSAVQGGWLSLPSVTGDGTAMTLTDPAATNSQRFYRIRESAPGQP
jgi:hypothetical protein